MKSDPPAQGLKMVETPTGVQFRVHVQPRASRNEICGIQGEELRLRLTAPPVDDAANRLCIQFLADRLMVAKSRVTISSGLKSRHKSIKVEGMDGNALLSHLQLTSEG